jgi:CHASE2 domain-containing sensor protein
MSPAGGRLNYRPHLFVLCALVAVLLTGIPTVLSNFLVDLRFRYFPRQASGDVVLVAIDSRSIETIGVWPWPRKLHADLIQKLASAGVTDVAFDVDFSVPSSPESDQAFASALLSGGGSVILPAFKQLSDSAGAKTIHVNRPLSQFAAHAWPAIVNISAEPNGVVRRYPYGEVVDGTFYPSMAMVLAGKYEAGKGPLWVDFSIGSASVPTISYIDILHGDPDALTRLRGKKAVIGGTALELGDRFNIPNGQVVPGALLQVLAAETILQDRALQPSSDIVRFGFPLLVALIMLVLW